MMQPAQSKWYRWYTVGMLAVVYASSHVDRQIMAIVLQPIKEELGASDTQMGFLIGLTFALFYATLGMPIAMLADRTNRRNIIAIAVTVWSGMTVLCGYAGTFVQMALARIGVAIGEAGSTPPSHSMIADLFASHERASAMGLYVAGINVGLLVAYLAGGWIVDNWGWRAAFVTVGLPGLLIAVMLVLTVREPKRGGDKGIVDIHAPSFTETVSYIMRHRTLCYIIFGNSVASFVGYGMVLWLPTFLLRSHDFSATQAGFTMAMLIGVGGAIGTLLSGRIVDAVATRDARWRVWAIAISLVAPLPLAVGFLLLDNLALAFALYVLPAMFGAFYIAPTAALIQHCVPVKMRALAAAITLFMANIIGLGLGPQGVGILSDFLEPRFGIHSLRYALVIFSTVGIASAWFFWRAGRSIMVDKTYS